jgi:hypothetical protein
MSRRSGIMASVTIPPIGRLSGASGQHGHCLFRPAIEYSPFSTAIKYTESTAVRCD